MPLTPSEFDDTGEVTFTPNSTNVDTGSTFQFDRDGHVVVFKLVPKTKVAYTTSKVIGTVDTKPKSAVYFPMLASSNYDCCGYVVISASTGNATFYPATGATIESGATLYCSGSYFIK